MIGTPMVRVIYILILIALLLYVAYAGLFFAMQRQIVFPRALIAPPPIGIADSVPGLEQIWLEISQGKVEAWYLPPLNLESGISESQQVPAFIIAHGNGEFIDRWPPLVAPLRQMGIAVLLVEYPGYGRSQGQPSQASITETMTMAYDWLVARPEVDSLQIILYGHSLGGGAVCTLATRRPSAALILFSTFTSVKAMAASQYLPGFLALDPFDNLAVVRNYPNPVLVLHGTRDGTIPYQHGVILHEAAQDGTLITYECGHNDCVPDWGIFWQEVAAFLQQKGVDTGSAQLKKES